MWQWHCLLAGDVIVGNFFRVARRTSELTERQTQHQHRRLGPFDVDIMFLIFHSRSLFHHELRRGRQHADDADTALDHWGRIASIWDDVALCSPRTIGPQSLSRDNLQSFDHGAHLERYCSGRSRERPRSLPCCNGSVCRTTQSRRFHCHIGSTIMFCLQGFNEVLSQSQSPQDGT